MYIILYYYMYIILYYYIILLYITVVYSYEILLAIPPVLIVYPVPRFFVYVV